MRLRFLIYLAILSVFFGIIGLSVVINNFSGKIIDEPSEEFSYQEVKENNNKESCWFASHKEVYDITLFLQIYDKNLNWVCGNQVELDNFQKDVQKILEIYKIGKLK